MPFTKANQETYHELPLGNPGKDGYTPSVTDKTGLYKGNIVSDAEYERWIRMGEETDQYSHGRIPVQDPWYRIVSGCALKVGLEGVRSRCRNAGLKFEEREKLPGIAEFCIKEQRDALRRVKSAHTYSIATTDVKSPETIHEHFEEPPSERFPQGHVWLDRDINPYEIQLKEVREEAIVGVYDSLGVPSPESIKRTRRMNMIRPFSSLVAENTLGDVSMSQSGDRKEIASKIASAVDASLAEYDACVKREWEASKDKTNRVEKAFGVDLSKSKEPPKLGGG